MTPAEILDRARAAGWSTADHVLTFATCGLGPAVHAILLDGALPLVMAVERRHKEALGLRYMLSVESVAAYLDELETPCQE